MRKFAPLFVIFTCMLVSGFVANNVLNINKTDTIKDYKLEVQRNVGNKENKIIKDIDNTMLFKKVALKFIDDQINEDHASFFEETINKDYLINKFLKLERPELFIPKPKNIPFTVKIPTGYAGDAYGFGYQGRLIIPDSGTNTEIYRCHDQATVDRLVSIVYDWSGGLGVPGSSPVLAAHNNRGPFRGLGNLRPGSKIYIDTFYGQFIYEVTGAVHAEAIGGNIYWDGGDLASWGRGGGSGLALQTCYPFNAAVTSGRYLVFAQLVGGTQLQ